MGPEGQDDKYVRTFFLHEDAEYWEQYNLRGKDFSFIRPASAQRQKESD